MKVSGINNMPPPNVMVFTANGRRIRGKSDV